MPRPRSGDGACPALPARPRLGGGGRCATRRSATSSAKCGRSPSPSLAMDAGAGEGSVMRRLRVPARGPAAPAPGARHPSLRLWLRNWAARDGAAHQRRPRARHRA
ncbi:hypothetical protein G6F68_019958 [Rhizopus microsporus]|nr:hypothetical protein G6F68_019958 [Rhizopus microsporus]